jgi:hypothetical protein
VNQVRFEALKRRLGCPARRPSELLLKAQAARELSEAGIFDKAAPETVERVRTALEALLMTCEASGTWQADRAAGITGRVLDQLELVEIAREKPRYEGGFWNHPDIPDRDRLAILETELLAEMARSQGWLVQWQVRRPIDDERIAFLSEQAEGLFAADDPVAAANAWLDENYRPEALLIGFADDSAPLGDAA